jgi:hypothetical protein
VPEDGLSISEEIQDRKILGGQPMLIFASDVWATTDINPGKIHIGRQPYLLEGSFSSWVRIHQNVHKIYYSTEWWL